MSVTFISQMTESINQIQVDALCDKIWKSKPETAIKLFFFVRDKNQGKNGKKAFVKIMTWLFSCHPETFYKNFSLIVGVPNSHTFKMVHPEEMLKDSYSKHENILDYFINPEYKQTFRNNWNESAIHELLRAYNMPVYGDPEDLIEIAESIRKTNNWPYDKFRKERIYYVVINVLCKLNVTHSNLMKTLIETLIETYPEYRIDDYINYDKTSDETSNKISEKTSDKTSDKISSNTHSSFVERFRFVSI